MKSRLKEAIKERGITQKFIYDKVGINKSTMTELVNGKRDPSLQTAYRISKVLGVKIEDIWYEDDEE